MSSGYSKLTVGLLSAAMVSAALVGCGGGGTAAARKGSVAITGSLATTSVAIPRTVDARTAPVTVTLTDGTTLTMVGGLFNAGDPALVIPAGTIPVSNLHLAGRAPGDVMLSVDGGVATKIDTLVDTSRGLELAQGIGMYRTVLTKYRIEFVGPFTLGTAESGLSIGSIAVNFHASPTVNSVPEAYGGVIPVNGGSLHGADLYEDPFKFWIRYVGSPVAQATLEIAKSNGSKSMTKPSEQWYGPYVTGFTFTSEVLDALDAIPTAGVQRIELTTLLSTP